MNKNSNSNNDLDENDWTLIRESQNNIILFGSVGSGKTTLCNKLTSKDFITANSGFSCTRELQYATSLMYDNVIIDFPGLNASIDIVKHLKIQRETLRQIPFRMICFVIEWTARYDNLVKSISQMMHIFKNHKENVVVIITKTENAKITETSDVEHVLKNKYKINNIIFTGNKDRPEDILNKIEKYKEKMQNQAEAIVCTKDFYQTVETEFDPKVIDIREKYVKEFLNVLSNCNKEFDNSQDSELKRSIYFFLYKDYKDRLIKNYGEEVRPLFEDQEEYIAELIMFTNSIYDDINKFRMKAQKSLEIQSVNYQGELNRYKKCEKCGLIWFRVFGCNSIKCGKRSISKDRLFGVFSSFKIAIDNFCQLLITPFSTKTEENQQFNDQEIYGLTKEEEELNKSLKTKIKYEGCGNKMDWFKMEDVTPWVLEQLKIIENTDMYNQVHEVGEKFSK